MSTRSTPPGPEGRETRLASKGKESVILEYAAGAIRSWREIKPPLVSHPEEDRRQLLLKRLAHE